MNRKKEIAYDMWSIMCKVYDIHPLKSPSEKQEKLINDIVEYIDTNLGTRRKRQETKEKECSTESKSS